MTPQREEPTTSPHQNLRDIAQAINWAGSIRAKSRSPRGGGASDDIVSRSNDEVLECQLEKRERRRRRKRKITRARN